MSELPGWGWSFRIEEQGGDASSAVEGSEEDLVGDEVQRAESSEWSDGQEANMGGEAETGSDRSLTAHYHAHSQLLGPLMKRRVCAFMMKISRLWSAFCPAFCAANTIFPPISFLELSNLWSEFMAEGFPFAFERNIVYHQETALKQFGLLQGN